MAKNITKTTDTAIIAAETALADKPARSVRVAPPAPKPAKRIAAKASATVSGERKLAAKPRAKGRLVSNPTRSLRKSDRRAMASELLKNSIDAMPNNSGRFLKLALRPNGATGLELGYCEGWGTLHGVTGERVSVRKGTLDRVAARFGYTVKMVGEAKDGSPRYKFV